jgi:hypothetical protein
MLLLRHHEHLLIVSGPLLLPREEVIGKRALDDPRGLEEWGFESEGPLFAGRVTAAQPRDLLVGSVPRALLVLLALLARPESRAIRGCPAVAPAAKVRDSR